jgi:hypothetical protein
VHGIWVGREEKSGRTLKSPIHGVEKFIGGSGEVEKKSMREVAKLLKVKRK